MNNDSEQEIKCTCGHCGHKFEAKPKPKHLLIIGDCTDKATVERLMHGERAELLFTSPPYADMREYSGNDLSLDVLVKFIPAFKPFAEYQAVNLGIKRDDGAVVQYWDNYIKAALDCEYRLLSWNVWDQEQNGSIGKLTAMFPIEHEFIFVFGKKQKQLNLTVHNKSAGERHSHVKDRQADGTTVKKKEVVIRDKRPMGTVQRINPQLARNLDTTHPAMFPIELPSAYVESMTNVGDIVAEPFNGSGTTIIACEQLDRRCFACEISPDYVAVALQRYQDSTGQTPVLINSFTVDKQ